MRSAAKKIITAVLILFFLSSSLLFAEVFEYRHVKDAQYRILSVVDQAVFINGVLSHRAETLNRIAVEVTDVRNGNGIHKAVFQTSERIVYDSQNRLNTAVSGFHWTMEYESEFERDRLGRLTIAPQYFMPVVRNVPTFPGRDLSVGDRWYSEGHEVHDFRGEPFRIAEPYNIPFNAFYEYIGEREWKGKNYPAFSITYNIESRPPAVRGNLYPVRISGSFNQLVYWDREAGQERAYTEEFRLTFYLSSGDRIEYRGTAEAEYVESETMNRHQLVSEIAGEIERLDMGNIQVTATDEGISISLENIQFYADSDVMLPGEQEKLAKIAEILLRYPQRDILVAGHTALSGTAEQRMALSQDRARAVAGYLLSRNVRTPDRIVIRGYGAEKPVADNGTQEGMSRNRRVEIILLEN